MATTHYMCAGLPARDSGVSAPGSSTAYVCAGLRSDHPGVSITSVTPTSGGIAGGTTVTIEGSGFLDFQATGYVTGDGAAWTINSWTETTIEAETAAHDAGVIDVAVGNDNGSADTSVGAYTFSAPAVTGATSEAQTGIGIGISAGIFDM